MMLLSTAAASWIEPIPHTHITGHMTGIILNPAKDNPVSIISTSTTDDLFRRTRSECASTAEISWFVSFENGSLIDVDSSKDQISDWLPENFYQYSSWQNGSLHESIMTIDFTGFLKKNVTLSCGSNTNSTLTIGTYTGPIRSRQYDMEVTMSERDAWKVVFAVPLLVLVALFVASKRVNVWSGEDSCCMPCKRDYDRMYKPEQSPSNV